MMKYQSIPDHSILPETQSSAIYTSYTQVTRVHAEITKQTMDSHVRRTFSDSEEADRKRCSASK